MVTVYSEPDKGTAFNIIIPAAANALNESESNENALLPGIERIMLVDDEHAIVKSLSSILRSAGYRITEFTDSMQAIDNFKYNFLNYDIVITDNSMPKLTGTDLAKEIKRYNPQIPVILMSGFVNKNIENSAKELGVDLIVNKPISAVKLTELIRRFFDNNASNV